MSVEYRAASITPTGEKRGKGFLWRRTEERYNVSLIPESIYRSPVCLGIWAESDDQARAKAQSELDRYNRFYEEQEALLARVMRIMA